MDEQIKKIRDIFHDYSIEDIATSLFVTELYPLNISSPVKSALLWEILRNADPTQFNPVNQITDYKSYMAFIARVIEACPQYPTVEDYIPIIEWGDVKYKFQEVTYKFFYSGDLENPYDYLLVYEKFIVENQDEIQKTTGRLPADEMENILWIQDQIILSIPYVKKGKIKAHGEFAPADKKFWQKASKFHVAFSADVANKLSADFLDLYSEEISADDKYKYEEIPGKVMEGNSNPYVFLNIGDKYFLAGSRKLNSVLFTSLAKLLKENKITFSRQVLNRAVYRFLNDRFDDVFGPLVNVVARHDDSLDYAAAFIAGDELKLIYVIEPQQNNQLDLDATFAKVQEDLKALSENKNQILDALTMQIVEWQATDKRTLKPTAIIVAPFLPTAFSSFTIPKDAGIRVVLADEFFSIFDMLKDLREYGDYLDYMATMSQIPMPFAREIDKYASYKHSKGTLIRGATAPTMISLVGGMGGDYRYEQLSKFWKNFPRSEWGGSSPTVWSIDDEGSCVRIYLRKDGFQNVYYVQLGHVDFFALAPYHLLGRDMELVRVTDLMSQIIVDYMVTYVKKPGVKNIVNHTRLKFIVYPSELLDQPDFEHLAHLNPGDEPWKMDIGQPVPHDLAIRVVINKEAVCKKADAAKSNELEIDLALDVFKLLEPFNKQETDRIIPNITKRKGSPKRFSIDMIEKRVSFPERSLTIIPDIDEYKFVDNTIAKTALSNSLKPKLYSGEKAVTLINELRDIIKASLEAEILKYDTALSLPILFEGNDALINEREMSRTQLSASQKRDVDFDIPEKEKAVQADYLHFTKLYRYVIEKFVQLQPSTGFALDKKELKRLIALADRLMNIYDTSSVIRYSLVEYPPKLRVEDDFIVDVVDDKRTEKNNTTLEAEEAAIRLKYGAGSALHSENYERHVDDLNDAFLNQYGFELKNMYGVLDVLANWASNASKDEDTNYSADLGELKRVIAASFKIKITEEEIGKILDFLTLKQETILKLSNDATDQADVPVWEHKKRPMRYALRPLIVIGGKYYWGPYSCYRAILTWD